MSHLVESLKVKNRQLFNIMYHNRRLNFTRFTLFNAKEEWDLEQIISIPVGLSDDVYKCRVIYGNEIKNIEFIPYKMRKIENLYLVYNDEVDYTFKYVNKESLDILKKKLINPEINDILIVKHGFITDTSYSNIIFYDGQQWLTPVTTLLKGTKRQFYLENGIIKEKEIRVTDLNNYQKARIINAMVDMEDEIDIPISNIRLNF